MAWKKLLQEYGCICGSGHAETIHGNIEGLPFQVFHGEPGQSEGVVHTRSDDIDHVLTFDVCADARLLGEPALELRIAAIALTHDLERPQRVSGIFDERGIQSPSRRLRSSRMNFEISPDALALRQGELASHGAGSS